MTALVLSLFVAMVVPGALGLGPAKKDVLSPGAQQKFVRGGALAAIMLHREKKAAARELKETKAHDETPLDKEQKAAAAAFTETKADDQSQLDKEQKAAAAALTETKADDQTQLDKEQKAAAEAFTETKADDQTQLDKEQEAAAEASTETKADDETPLDKEQKAAAEAFTETKADDQTQLDEGEEKLAEAATGAPHEEEEQAAPTVAAEETKQSAAAALIEEKDTAMHPLVSMLSPLGLTAHAAPLRAGRGHSSRVSAMPPNPTLARFEREAGYDKRLYGNLTKGFRDGASFKGNLTQGSPKVAFRNVNPPVGNLTKGLRDDVYTRTESYIESLGDDEDGVGQTLSLHVNACTGSRGNLYRQYKALQLAQTEGDIIKLTPRFLKLAEKYAKAVERLELAQLQAIKAQKMKKSAKREAVKQATNNYNSAKANSALLEEECKQCKQEVVLAKGKLEHWISPPSLQEFPAPYQKWAFETVTRNGDHKSHASHIKSWLEMVMASAKKSGL